MRMINAFQHCSCLFGGGGGKERKGKERELISPREKDNNLDG